MTLKQKCLLLGILLLAIFFRFYQIALMPAGLFPDEAANGLDINLMQQGQLQPFYERGNGREALFFYMLWGSVEIFGKGPWQHHIVSASIGVLAVFVCFLVAKRLFLIDANNSPHPYRAASIGLLAAFLMAVSSWHVVLSRTAFRANLIPLFTSLTVYFLLCAHQSQNFKKRIIYSFLTGASFGLGFYSYIAYRIMVPILLMIILWPLLAKLKEKQFWKTVINYKLSVISFLLAFALFIFPLAGYFYTHPGSFVGRSGQVSVFNPDLNQGNLPGAIWQVFKESMLGYFTLGDLNWRHNISGFPFLTPLVSPFFGFGLIVITLLAAAYFLGPSKRRHLWKYFLLAGWFWGMLLPVITTAEGIPHGLRAIGTIPAVFIISAWALYKTASFAIKFHKRLWQHILYQPKDPEWVKNNHFVPGRLRLLNFGLKAVAICFVAALIFQTYFLYFVYAAHSPENYYAFRGDLASASEYLVNRCDKAGTYLILDKFSVQTTDYLTSNKHGNFNDKCSVPYRQVDPENAWQLSNLSPGDEIVFVQSSIFDIKKFKQYHPKALLRLEQRNKFGQAIMAVYKINY